MDEIKANDDELIVTRALIYEWAKQHKGLSVRFPTARMKRKFLTQAEFESAVEEMASRKIIEIVSKTDQYTEVLISPELCEQQDLLQLKQNKNVKEINESLISERSRKRIIFELVLQPDSQIFLVGPMVRVFIGRTKLNMANDDLIAHIFAHPNREIPMKELAKHNQGKEVDIYKSLGNVNIKKDILKIFFKVNKQCVVFTNRISQEYFKSFGISKIEVPSRDRGKSKEE